MRPSTSRSSRYLDSTTTCSSSRGRRSWPTPTASSYSGHNYYLYLDPKTNKLRFLPWDLDRAFANFPILGSNSQQMNLSLTRSYAGPHRLTERRVGRTGVAEQVPRVAQGVVELNSVRQGARLLKQLGARRKRRSRSRSTGTRRPRPRAREAAAPANFMFGIKPPAMKSFVEKRTASVAARMAGTSKGLRPDRRVLRRPAAESWAYSWAPADDGGNGQGRGREGVAGRSGSRE